MAILAFDTSGFWTSAAFGAICSAAIVTLGGGLFQWYLKQRSDKQLEKQKAELASDLERHKNDLKVDADSEIERLRTKLRLDAFRHETRFQHLHQKRADLIVELYEKIKTMQTSMKTLAISQDEKIVEALGKSFWELTYFCDQNEIYFSEYLISKIHDLNFAGFNRAISKNQSQSPIEYIESIDKMVAHIRSEFREIIGVEK